MHDAPDVNDTPWPGQVGLSHAVDRLDDGRWSADVFLSDAERDRTVATLYLGTDFETEADARAAVDSVEDMSEDQLRALDWQWSKG